MAYLNKLCGSWSCKSIYSCESKICKLKPNFVIRNKVISTSSKRTKYIDCNSPNTMHLITCNIYSLQYVGETVPKLNESFNLHKTGFNHPGKHGSYLILSDHFHKDVFWSASYSVKILKSLEGNGRIARNALDAFITSRRKQRD